MVRESSRESHPELDMHGLDHTDTSLTDGSAVTACEPGDRCCQARPPSIPAPGHLVSGHSMMIERLMVYSRFLLHGEPMSAGETNEASLLWTIEEVGRLVSQSGQLR